MDKHMTAADTANLDRLIRGCVAAKPYVLAVTGPARVSRIREVVSRLVRQIFGGSQ